MNFTVKKLPGLLLPVLVLFAGLSSCKFDPNWDTELEAPVAKMTLTPQNIVPDGTVLAGSGGDLTYVFDKSVFRLPVDSLLNIPDTTINYSFTAPISLTISPGTTVPVFDNYLNFNVTQAALLEAIVLNGSVDLDMYSYASQPLEMKVFIPKARKNGQAFTQIENVPAANGNTPSNLSTSRELSGYALDFTGDNGNLNNRLRLQISATLPANGQPVSIAAGQQLVGLTFKLRNIKPYYARGNLFTQDVDFSQDTLRIGAFSIIKSGTVELEDLLMKLNVTNSIGADLQVKIQELTGVNSRTGQTVSLIHPVIGGSFNINRAINNQWHNPEFYSTYQEILMNTGNSNLKAFAENLPDKIKLRARFIINPNGPLSGGNDFIYASGNSELGIYAESPFKFSMQNLVLSDTVSINMEKLLSGEKIKGVGFNLYVDNAFPLQANTQAYFLNAGGAVIDSLFFSDLIAQANVDASYYVTSPSQSVLKAELNRASLDCIRDAKSLRFVIRFNTAGQPAKASWKDGYFMGLKLTAKLIYNI